MTRPANPFRCFKSSPEVIRLVVIMYGGSVRLSLLRGDFYGLLAQYRR